MLTGQERFRRTSLAGCLVFALLGATFQSSAPAAAPPLATSTELVKSVDALRADNGLPAGILERPDWSAACAQHDRYMEKTGDLTHYEDAKSPFYTDEGAWAGRNSVLSFGGAWTTDDLVWLSAPIHLSQLLNPRLAEMGAHTSARYSCATTWPGATRPSPSEITAYTFPGSGVTDVPWSERAFEYDSSASREFVPGDLVGLPSRTTTGPYLYIFLDGPIRDASVTGATLVGPEGPVKIAYVGSDNPRLSGFVPEPMAFVIPRKPLEPSTTYAATTDFIYETDDGASGTKAVQFSFTTADPPTLPPRPPKKKRARLILRKVGKHAPKFSLRADDVLVGRRARVQVVHYSEDCSDQKCNGLHTKTESSIKLRANQKLTVKKLNTDVWMSVQVGVRSFEIDGVSYTATHAASKWHR